MKDKILENIKACIFDLDGTLVDSMWLWKAIDIEYLARFGLTLPEDLQTCIEGMSFSETAVYIKNRFNIPDSLETMKETWNQMAWDKYSNEVPLKPGAKQFLDKCRQKGIKLGIATSNSKALVSNVTKVLVIEDYFDCIMTACEVNKGKPAPDIYLAVANELGVCPNECLVFEDIVAGIMAGHNAGMKVCAVEDAYSSNAREAKKREADYYINDYFDLL